MLLMHVFHNVSALSTLFCIIFAESKRLADLGVSKLVCEIGWPLLEGHRSRNLCDCDTEARAQTKVTSNLKKICF